MPNYPALFLLTNSSRAQWYQVLAENKIELLHETFTEKYELSDHEGSFRSRGKVGAPDVMSKMKLAEEKKYMQQVAEHTKKIIGENSDAVLLTYASPEQLKNELKTILQPLCGTRPLKYVAGNHVGGSKEKLLALFKESLKVFNG